ncbi:MAG: hypothetical protein R3B60_00280 [Candidatus Paceibacterota bacterium]
MHFGSADTPIETKPYRPEVKEVRTVKKTENPMEKYGRFTVELLPNGERKIYGGQFVPKEELSFWSNKKHVITVNYTTKELAYYRRGLDGYEPVIGFAVVTPSPDTLPKDVVRGIVTKIDTMPTWCPTSNIRRVMAHLPLGCLPYGHPLNAMGEVKFEIKWDVKGWELHRIHGTEGYADNGRFWEIETFGCTRLQNRAIKNLVELLGPDVEPEDIEVIVYK